MKKNILALFVIAIVWVLVGCSAESTDEIINGAEQIVGELAEDAVNGAVEIVEDKVDEKINQVEQFKTNAWGNFIGCNHEPKNYKPKKNMVFCKCGANKFDNLTYEEFSSCVSFWDKGIEKKDIYCAEAFLKYKGVNPIFFELMDELDLKTHYSETLTKLEKLSEDINKLNIGKTVLVNYVGGADLEDKVAKFDNVFGTSLTVVQSVINLHQMMDEKEDPFKACDEFIETVKGPIGLLSSATGGANTFTIVGLNSLQTVLSAYQIGHDANKKNLEYTSELSKDPADGALITKWISIKETEVYWKQVLTYEHIMGIDMVDELKLPSLQEIMAEYEGLSSSGKAYADEYIIFCLDFVFEDTLGISYQEYIQFLSE